MTFREGLFKARSHIIMVVGMVAAFGTVIWLENWKPAMESTGDDTHSKTLVLRKMYDPALPSPESLTSTEIEWARTAWKYFEVNTDTITGLVGSVANYPSTTLWDTGSYLMGLISAYKLGIIEKSEFSNRLERALNSLATLPLVKYYNLPNKAYNIRTLQMVDYNNIPAPEGIGWSAIDIGRLLAPFNIIVWSYPEFTPLVNNVIKKWEWQHIFADGEMVGGRIDTTDSTGFQKVQEGRLGYEQYAAKSFILIGADMTKAYDYESFVDWIEIYGEKVAVDRRSSQEFGAHNFVVSEPYILDGIEFGSDRISRDHAHRVYLVQKSRYEKENIPTAVSEDNIDQAPYFVYNTVYSDGKIWNCVTDQGIDASQFKSLSTKAVFGWYALYRDDYTKLLTQKIKDNFDPLNGWFAGIYEQSGESNRALTCNTNGIILEAICYKTIGKLLELQIQADTTYE